MISFVPDSGPEFMTNKFSWKSQFAHDFIYQCNVRAESDKQIHFELKQLFVTQKKSTVGFISYQIGA